MHYITMSVPRNEGQEKHIDTAIGQGLEKLSNEMNAPCELADVAYAIIGESIYVTVLAKPYEPPKPVDIASLRLDAPYGGLALQ